MNLWMPLRGLRSKVIKHNHRSLFLLLYLSLLFLKNEENQVQLFSTFDSKACEDGVDNATKRLL